METTETTKIENNTQKHGKKEKVFLVMITVIILMLLEAVLLWWFFIRKTDAKADIPEVKICTDNKVSLSDGVISLPVTLSDMPEDELYPAASFTITFDNSKLEFAGLGEGNIMVLADENAQGGNLNLPEWQANTAFANQSGRLNIMYLDTTAGRYAFCDDGFISETQNVLFYINFKLRGSAKSGDVYDLIIKDACIASSDEEKSLATTRRTLNTKDGRLVISD